MAVRFDPQSGAFVVDTEISASDITGVLAAAHGGTGADGSSVAPNRVLAGPASGGAGAVSYRALVAADLPNSGATAGTYGSATQVPQVTVDAFGRITSVSNVSISSGVPTSRQVIAGIGLSGGGALSSDVMLTVVYGTSATSACVGNDSRLSDVRTPTLHASSHASGGSDAVALAASQVTSGVFDNARVNWAAPSAIGGTTPADGSFSALISPSLFSFGTIVITANAGLTLATSGGWPVVVTGPFQLAGLAPSAAADKVGLGVADYDAQAGQAALEEEYEGGGRLRRRVQEGNAGEVFLVRTMANNDAGVAVALPPPAGGTAVYFVSAVGSMAIFSVNEGGDVGENLDVGNNFIGADQNGFFCFYNDGGVLKVRNRSGATRTVMVWGFSVSS